MVYVQQRGVTHVITPDGVFDPEDNPTGRFRNVGLLSNTTTAKGYVQLERNPLLTASDGVFQVDFKGRKVNRLIDAEVGSAAIELPQIAAAIAFWISGRRGAARKIQVLWTVLGAIVGVAALPAIIAIHAKLIHEPCPRCDKPRQIDTTVCEGCGADWDRLPRDGTEVIGGWLPEKLTQAEHSA